MLSFGHHTHRLLQSSFGSDGHKFTRHNLGHMYERRVRAQNAPEHIVFGEYTHGLSAIDHKGADTFFVSRIPSRLFPTV